LSQEDGKREGRKKKKCGVRTTASPRSSTFLKEGLPENRRKKKKKKPLQKEHRSHYEKRERKGEKEGERFRLVERLQMKKRTLILTKSSRVGEKGWGGEENKATILLSPDNEKKKSNGGEKKKGVMALSRS